MRPEIDVWYMFKAIFNQWSLGLLWKITSRSQSIFDFAVSCRTDVNTHRLQLPLCFVSSVDKGEEGRWVDRRNTHMLIFQAPELKATDLSSVAAQVAQILQRNLVEKSEVPGFCPLNIHPETHRVTVQQTNEFQFMEELREKCLFLICYPPTPSSCGDAVNSTHFFVDSLFLEVHDFCRDCCQYHPLVVVVVLNNSTLHLFSLPAVCKQVYNRICKRHLHSTNTWILTTAY